MIDGVWDWDWNQEATQVLVLRMEIWGSACREMLLLAGSGCWIGGR